MIGCAFVLLSSMLLHPAAESLAEIQWNGETGTVEVALRLRITDEQQLLRTVSSRETDSLLGDEEALESAALSVIRRRIGFGNLRDMKTPKTPAPVADQYHWVGRRGEGGHAWWFFEVAMPEGRPTHLRCTLFEKPSSEPQNRGASSHDHLHAAPISTFLVLPDSQPETRTPAAGDESSKEPKSLTVTPDRPISAIQWSVPAS